MLELVISIRKSQKLTMKINNILAAIALLSGLLFASISQAQPSYWAPIRSGNWSDTNAATSPWSNGITNILAPGTNTIVEVDDNIVITVDVTNAVCEILDSLAVLTNIGTGTVIMAPNSTLTVYGKNEGYGTQSLGYLIATATNCTVIYRGNAFWAQRTDYYNLVFAGWGDFYNGSQNGYPITPMTVYGNMTVNGTNIPSDQPGYTGVYVELGGDFTIMGDFYLGTSNAWDCSLSDFVVMGNTFCEGFLWDQDAADGSNYFAGNFTVPPSSMAITNIRNTLLQKYNSDNTNAPVTVIYGGLDLQTGTNWNMGANLTNNGLIQGQGYGSINFNGSGVIAGSNAITIPTMVVNGSYEIGTTVTLTTNTPIFNGTLTFDLANTNQIVLQSEAGTALYYNGNLNVINSGAPTPPGASFTFFSCPNGFGGIFGGTSFPSLPNGLSWVDNTLTSGSISVFGTIVGSPTLAVSRNGNQLTLSWDTATYSGYSLQAQTNHGIGSNWSSTGITASPYTVTINPANPAVFYRLSNP
jgi:hypothetical protein